MPAVYDQAVVAAYKTHADAEDAVRRLQQAGLPMQHISIIGRDFQVREDVQGYYRPSDAVAEGAGGGAWVGGLFGLLMGFGFFLVPAVGPLFALGPLAGLIAGALGGAGIGAIIGALTSIGIPEDQALKLQARVQAGEFLVLVQGTPDEIGRARDALAGTAELPIDTATAVSPATRAAA